MGPWDIRDRKHLEQTAMTASCLSGALPSVMHQGPVLPSTGNSGGKCQFQKGLALGQASGMHAGLALVAADSQESKGIVYSLVSVLCFKGFVSEISSLVKWTEGTIFSINHYLSAPKHLSFNPHFFKLEESRNNSIIDQDFHKEFCISPCCKEDLKFLAN